MIDYEWVQFQFQEFTNVFPEILNMPESSIVDPHDKDTTYYKSSKYLYELSGQFHTSHFVEKYIDEIIVDLSLSKKNIIDVGCALGHTGLKFVEREHFVTFYDFPGIGLAFLEWLKIDQGFNNMITKPYGSLNDKFKLDKEDKFDIILAFDVMEHTGNHLGFLKWLEHLGNKVYLCFPYVDEYFPPYVPRIDEWVDTDTIIKVIKRRYKNVDFLKVDGRLYAEYEIE